MSEDSNPDAFELRQRIVGLMEERAVSPLLEATLEYLRQFPESSWGWLVSAPTLIDLGRYDDAKAALDSALEHSGAGNNAAAAADAAATICYWRCVLYKEKGDLKRAQRFIRQALEADERNGSYWVTLGDVLAKRGKRKAARKALKSAIALADSNMDEAYYNLALLLRAERSYEAALAQVTLALEIDPEYPEAHELRRDLEAVLKGSW